MAGTHGNRDAVVKRLKRIEGQVKGIGRMLEEDRYCIDILHQIQAVKKALSRAETELLRTHAAACVDEALASGSKASKREKIIELVDLFERVR
ncbi:MAG: metal-sensitive transcriptional regulator [Xanthomonadales bacterium]|nr:metal-sensitive transcriptional regulator [Xanthomonadales bacterium]